MQEIRRDNLRKLAAQWGGVGKLAEKLGYANASFLVQMCGPNPIREVTERTARRVEETLGLPRGWLDRDGHAEPESDVVALVRAVAAVVTQTGVTVTPEKFADLIGVIYRKMGSKIDTDYIESVVGLLK